MNSKKRIFVIILQLLVIIVCGILFYTFAQKTIDPVNVYVYSKTIDNKNYPLKTSMFGGGDAATEEAASNIGADVHMVTIPKNALTPNMVTDPKDIEGKYLDSKVYAGQYVYKEQLVDEGNVDYFNTIDLKNYRKISIPVDYTTALSGNLKRGDKVDLIFSSEGDGKDSEGDDTTFTYAKTVLQDIPVYAVNTGDGYKFTDHSNKYDTSEMEDLTVTGTEYSTGELAILTLAVTLEQAEEIEARMKKGDIRIVGRFDESENYQTLGYVIGDYDKVFTGNVNAETNKASVTN